MLGIVPVPTYVSDILMLPGHDIRYIRMEKVILEYLHLVFDQYEVSDPNYICVTRNADVSPDDEALEVTDDFRKLMQQYTAQTPQNGGRTIGNSRETYPHGCRNISVRNSRSHRRRLPHEDADETGLYVLHRRKPAGFHEERSLIYEPFSPQKSALCTGRKHVKTGEKE